MVSNWSKRLTDEQRQYVAEHYATMTATDIALHLHCSKHQVWNYANSHGLHKEEGFIQRVGKANSQHPKSIATRFKKGNIPVNKGVKGYGNMSEKAKGNMMRTQFRKGNKPHNWKPIGSERISADGYRLIKIQDGKGKHNWQLEQIIVWEKANGKLEKGTCLWHKDGNLLNNNIENLEAISREEMMNRNTMHRLSPEVKRLINLKGVLNRQINKREKSL